jgi:hypothetical protein
VKNPASALPFSARDDDDDDDDDEACLALSSARLRVSFERDGRVYTERAAPAMSRPGASKRELAAGAPQPPTEAKHVRVRRRRRFDRGSIRSAIARVKQPLNVADFERNVDEKRRERR